MIISPKFNLICIFNVRKKVKSRVGPTSRTITYFIRSIDPQFIHPTTSTTHDHRGFPDCGIVRASCYAIFLVMYYKGHSILFSLFKLLNYIFKLFEVHLLSLTLP